MNNIKSVLVARIGYMDKYIQNGVQRPVNGGSYNEQHEGYEIRNFTPFDGFHYGYVSPPNAKTKKIKLERINPTICLKEDKLDEVLVIFIALNPKTKKTVVVGWYNNATVYRTRQKHKKLGFVYCIKVNQKDVIEVPHKKRIHVISHGKGYPGRSNCFYIYEDKQKEFKQKGGVTKIWVESLLSYIKKYNKVLKKPKKLN